tara:strand:+ start:1127 stop:1906 length:780 start_codon:yes stop_codon:yes gene_type:complete
MLNFVYKVGDITLRAVARLGSAVLFGGKILTSVPSKKHQWHFIVDQLFFIGVLSLIIIIISGAFIGMVVAMQGYHTLGKFGAQSQLSQLIALSVFRELGPVVTGLLYAGRAGSAITAEIGLMRVTEQITSMEVMAVNPAAYIAFPRIIAGILSMPMLTVIFCASAIMAGYGVSVYWLGVDGGMFVATMQANVDLYHDIFQGLAKSIMFGLCVTSIAIYQGFYAEKIARGLGAAATKTVVMSSVTILALDFILTALLLGS